VAASHKADLVDVEVFAGKGEKRPLITALQQEGVTVIASSHDFAKTDDRDTLLARFHRMDESGADILKMAVMPQTFENVADIMQVTSEMREETEKPLISMSMGSLGSISRIAGENFGSAVTFATVGAASAPGQFPIRELRMMMDALHGKNQE
jgi:3-dehydroquinate dehydratase-1